MQFDLNQERLQNYRAHGVPSPTFGGSKKAIKNGGVDGTVVDKVILKIKYCVSYFLYYLYHVVLYSRYKHSNIVFKFRSAEREVGHPMGLPQVLIAMAMTQCRKEKEGTKNLNSY